MDRREFVRLIGSGLTADAVAERLVSAEVAAQPGVKRSTPMTARMKAGTQHGDSDAILRVLAGFGVTHICSRLPSARMDGAWSVEGLSRLRERVESFGVTLSMVPLPLSSTEISRSENPAIFNVHFRNISGRFLDFRETFIDDGDVDMLRAMRVYKEVGYDGMMMPDHSP